MVVCRTYIHGTRWPNVALLISLSILGGRVSRAVADEPTSPATAAQSDDSGEARQAEAGPVDDKRRAGALQHFETKIAPLLERACVVCHNAEKREGGLALDSSAGLLAGGDSGSVVTPSDVRRSPLLEAVKSSGAASVEPPAMPKGRPALSQAEVAALEAWIESGAVWSAEKLLQANQAPDRTWWSLEPLTHSVASDVFKRTLNQPTNFVDAYIQSAQREHGLQSNPPAARRELIRRVTFDLTGLPSMLEDVQSFVADERPDAYERLVDRLLASPAYGERWARHWLDVVHYGETHGYDKDKPRNNAWPYRDYVIRSLNDDKPYRQFAAEQVAGDVLYAESGEATEAVGFLAAGPWDFIGHAEVPESKRDGKIARHLDRDDMLQNTFLTFQSLTVGCAQCHDHKFDPISQREYYGLQAVFSALDRADRKYYRQPELQSRFLALQARERELLALEQGGNQEIQRAAGSQLTELDSRLAELKKANNRKKYPSEHGYHSSIERDRNHTKWVQVDLGSSQKIARIEWIACHDDFAGIGDGFGAPPRWRLELSDASDFAHGSKVVVDRTQTRQPNPGIAPQTIEVHGETARYVRLTATELAERRDDAIFALAELRVFNSAGENVALGKPVTALDSIEAPPRWSRSNLVDDKYPRVSHDAEIAALERQREELLQTRVPRRQMDDQRKVVTELNEVRKALQSLPEASLVYAATIYKGQGTFKGTGANGGQPRPVHLLIRGDVSRPGPEVEPMALSCVSGLQARLGSTSSSDAERRRALALWLTNEANPLTWRSIANRLWAYHFDRGIVDTPNDFGRMGSEPTHPQLLDRLAIDVRDHQSLKRLQRLIVLSGTYQQASHADASRVTADPNNRWLARSPRSKLVAEAVRDSMLMVTGLLRREMGGPSYQDFVIQRPEHSPHYEYALHDQRDPKTMRRAIYRFIARSQTQPLMTSLDCADPSMQVDVRNESSSATQALSLLNNAFTLMAAEEWAKRVEQRLLAEGQNSPSVTATSDEAANTETANIEAAVKIMVSEAFAREANVEELHALSELGKRQSLVQVARVIFNLNEFFYVD